MIECGIEYGHVACGKWQVASGKWRVAIDILSEVSPKGSRRVQMFHLFLRIETKIKYLLELKKQRVVHTQHAHAHSHQKKEAHRHHHVHQKNRDLAPGMSQQVPQGAADYRQDAA